MPSVTVDAGVLAVPPDDCDPDEIHKYVDTILDWKKLLDESWVDIHMSERASESLFEDDLYPLRDSLNSLFQRHGIVEYDVNTITTVVDSLLQQTPNFETHFGLKDILAENTTTEPDILGSTKFDGLKSDLNRCAVLISILRKHCKQDPGGHSLILRDAPKKTIEVSTQIHELEHDREDIEGLQYHPEFFQGDLFACDDFRGLIECLDESQIFKDASNVQEIELAIRISMFKNEIRENLDPDWNALELPEINTQFRPTVSQCLRDQPSSLSPKILRAINETICQENMAAVHALRVNSGGNSSQRLRGQDKAQRRDIDNEFHLHYWECDNGKLELASVVYHNDFTIPE